VPLSNFVQRGFGFVHHSIAILYHEVPNPNITIRNFLIAVSRMMRGAVLSRSGWQRDGRNSVTVQPTPVKPGKPPPRKQTQGVSKIGS
jgi:hypothetical protein